MSTQVVEKAQVAFWGRADAAAWEYDEIHISKLNYTAIANRSTREWTWSGHGLRADSQLPDDVRREFDSIAESWFGCSYSNSDAWMKKAQA